MSQDSKCWRIQNFDYFQTPSLTVRPENGHPEPDLAAMSGLQGNIEAEKGRVSDDGKVQPARKNNINSRNRRPWLILLIVIEVIEEST